MKPIIEIKVAEGTRKCHVGEETIDKGEKFLFISKNHLYVNICLECGKDILNRLMEEL
jgi:hypothetical protein